MSKGRKVFGPTCARTALPVNYKRIFESGTDKSGVDLLGRRKQADVEPLATERK